MFWGYQFLEEYSQIILEFTDLFQQVFQYAKIYSVDFSFSTLSSIIFAQDAIVVMVINKLPYCKEIYVLDS